MQTKKIHFIGICGVAMSALAIAFHKKGYTVTGSDKGFYPPISTHLKDVGISFYPGWHVDKMTQNGNPDLIIVGNIASSQNPEWQYIQKHNIEYKSYPEAIAEFFCTEGNIVCAGTYGKTTTSTLLTWIIKQENIDMNYMFGGLAVNDMDSAYLSDGDTCCTLCILEGDEYKSSQWDSKPKFAHYSPTHLLLTAVQWDHADVYPTEQSYIDVFQTLVHNVAVDGSIIVHENVLSILSFEDIQISQNRFLSYGVSDKADYCIKNLIQNIDGLEFDILYDKKTYHINSPLFGTYNATNITACFAMAHDLNIKPKHIIKAIQSFKGIKRRLEKRFDGNITIIDDIAHSPAKAISTLKTLRDIYDGKIIAIFEPNTGNRQQESIPGYDHAFDSADEVIIPRLTHIKIDETKEKPLIGKTLCDVISKTHNNVHFMSDDEKLVEHIIQTTKKGDVVVFLGSHGFRGMIEKLINSLSDKH